MLLRKLTSPEVGDDLYKAAESALCNPFIQEMTGSRSDFPEWTAALTALETDANAALPNI